MEYSKEILSKYINFEAIYATNSEIEGEEYNLPSFNSKLITL